MTALMSLLFFEHQGNDFLRAKGVAILDMDEYMHSLVDQTKLEC